MEEQHGRGTLHTPRLWEVEIDPQDSNWAKETRYPDTTDMTRDSIELARRLRKDS